MITTTIMIAVMPTIRMTLWSIGNAIPISPKADNEKLRLIIESAKIPS